MLSKWSLISICPTLPIYSHPTNHSDNMLPFITTANVHKMRLLYQNMLHYNLDFKSEPEKRHKIHIYIIASHQHNRSANILKCRQNIYFALSCILCTRSLSCDYYIYTICYYPKTILGSLIRFSQSNGIKYWEYMG